VVERDIAGVVVAFATVPDKPFPADTDTLVTVPLPPLPPPPHETIDQTPPVAPRQPFDDGAIPAGDVVPLDRTIWPVGGSVIMVLPVPPPQSRIAPLPAQQAT